MEIELRERQEEHVRIYFEKVQSETVNRFLPLSSRTLEDAVTEYEKTLLPNATSFGRVIYADGEYIGDVWCYALGEEDPDAMLSFCVFEPLLWGRGIMTEAVSLFLDEITDRFFLKVIGAFAYADNVASHRVLLKNGFVLRERFIEDGVLSHYYELKTNEKK